MFLSCVFGILNYPDLINIIHYAYSVAMYGLLFSIYPIYVVKYLHILLSYNLLINLGYIYFFNENKIMIPFIIIAYFINLRYCYMKHENICILLTSYITFSSAIYFQLYSELSYNNNFYLYEIGVLFVPLFSSFLISFFTYKNVNF